MELDMLKLKKLSEVVEFIKGLPKILMDDRYADLKRKRDRGGWRYSEQDRIELLLLEASINELNNLMNIVNQARNRAEQMMPFPPDKGGAGPGPTPHFN